MKDEQIRENCDSMVGASCPGVACGGLVMTRTAILHVDEIHRSYSRNWEFKCPACGMGFIATDETLIFEALPAVWTLAPVCHA